MTWRMVGKSGVVGMQGAGNCKRVGEAWGHVCLVPPLSLCCSEALHRASRFGNFFLHGLVCQIVSLGIGQKLLNNDYAFGGDDIQ